MLPWGHFLVAILPATAYTLVRGRALPEPLLVYAVFLGSQFPDLIDKPLAHLLFVLPSGRVGLHSLPVAVPIGAVVLYVAWERQRLRLGGAFVFAWATHLLGDNYKVLLGSDPRLPPDLLWPFLAPFPRPLEPHWAGPGSVNVKLWTVFSVFVLGVTAYLLYREREPPTTAG